MSGMNGAVGVKAVFGSRQKRKTVEDRLEAVTAGVIREDEFYTRERFIHRMGLTRSAWDEMRKSGLPVSVSGKRKGVYGAHVIAFFASGRSAGCDGGLCYRCGDAALLHGMCRECDQVNAILRLAEAIEEIAGPAAAAV